MTIPNVELMEVGEDWPLASGPTTFTEEHLLSVVASQDDPGVHAPRLKVGHADGRLDGEPAFGKFVNLRIINNGQTLVGDLTGVPKWLASVMATAYPNRSIEGAFNYKSATGKKWDLICTNVALLGVMMPGISTLEDLEIYFGDEMPEGVEVAAKIAWPGKECEAGVLATYKDDKPIKGRDMKPRASVNVEDVRRSFYETVAAPGTDHYWWWIRTVQIEPQQVIVDDDDSGELYRIPYSIVNDEVEWGDPVAVEIEYVDLPEDAAIAAKQTTFYASAADSRPAERNQMDPKKLRETLGLSEDASDEDVTAKLTELQAAQKPAGETGEPAPEGEPQPDDEGEGSKKDPALAASEGLKIPDGMVLVDAATFEQTKTGATRANELWEERERTERDTAIRAAVDVGKFPPARAAHFAKLWDADKEGTKAIIAALQSGVIPVTELGTSEDGEANLATAEAYPEEWLTAAERARVAASREGTLQDPLITTERVSGAA